MEVQPLVFPIYKLPGGKNVNLSGFTILSFNFNAVVLNDLSVLPQNNGYGLLRAIAYSQFAFTDRHPIIHCSKTSVFPIVRLKKLRLECHLNLPKL